MSKLIYLDNAATTQVYPEVLQEMLPYFSEVYSNPSAIYSFASESKKAVDKARTSVAELINAKTDEIYFTGGGSESDNWALKATADAYASKGKHIITSTIEHHAILHTCAYLEKKGFEITYVNVDENGKVKLDELEAAIRPDTILISIMTANNEIGTIQPVREIGRIAHEHGVLFHTDAVQAFGHIPIDVDEMNIDMLSASGHKINGPKGIGVMYIRKGVKILSFIHGGAQERKRRAGTLNVPGIVGIGKAAEIAKNTMAERSAKEISLRDHLIDRILTEIPYVRLNGDRHDRLPNNVNVCFRYIEGESMLILLDQGTKLWALGSLKPIHSMTVVDGFLDLTFVENRGVAFGMLSGQRWLILVLTGVIAGALIYFYRTLPKKKAYLPLRAALLLVLSGAVGNIIDRVCRGYVVDFFEFTFFDWPVFNVADIYVVAGVILMVLLIVFVLKDEDLDLKKKKDE